jgi:hypothetical protein
MTNPPNWRVFLCLKKYLIVLKLSNPITAMKSLRLIPDFYRKHPIVKIDFTYDIWNESNNINIELDWSTSIWFCTKEIKLLNQADLLAIGILILYKENDRNKNG